MMGGPMEGTLFVLVHLHILHLTIVAHPNYIFLLLANDTHKIDLASNVVIVFL
jgi:hypothetical protein